MKKRESCEVHLTVGQNTGHVINHSRNTQSNFSLSRPVTREYFDDLVGSLGDAMYVLGAIGPEDVTIRLFEDGEAIRHLTLVDR